MSAIRFNSGKFLEAIPFPSQVLLLVLTLTSTVLYFQKALVYETLLERNYLGQATKTIDFHRIVVPFIQLIPHYAVYNLWVFVTAIFAEITVIGFLGSAVILVAGSRYSQRIWGSSDQTFVFLFLVGTATNLLTVLSVIALTMISGTTLNLTEPLGGGLSYAMGYLVLLKQNVPEHSIKVFKGALVLRVKDAPFVALLVSLAMSLYFRNFYPVLPCWLSLVVSWVYLRFFHSSMSDPSLPQPSGVVGVQRITGDASDAFAFVEFFPEVVKPWLGPFFNDIFELMCAASVVSAFSDDSVEESNARVASRRGATDTSERRRQAALKVLEERIAGES